MAEKNKEAKQQVIVIGHKNPDTDSICSAIAYAALKNRIDSEWEYKAGRAGDVNLETAFVLDRFGFKSPQNLEKAMQMAEAKIEDARRDADVDMIFFLLTDIRAESSRLVFAGESAAETAAAAFGIEASQGVLLDGVVSRKKQFIPAVLGAIDDL